MGTGTVSTTIKINADKMVGSIHLQSTRLSPTDDCEANESKEAYISAEANPRRYNTKHTFNSSETSKQIIAFSVYM